MRFDDGPLDHAVLMSGVRMRSVGRLAGLLLRIRAIRGPMLSDYWLLLRLGGLSRHIGVQ